MLNGPSFIPQTVKKILIMLHGYGANGDDLFDLGKMLTTDIENIAVYSPHAIESFELAPFGYQWFGLPDLLESTIEKGIHKAMPRLLGYIDDLVTKHGLTHQDVILFGFSQGCMMSLALIYYRDIGAVIGASGMLVKPKDPEIKHPKTKVLLTHGTLDMVVPFPSAPMSKTLLEQDGVDVNLAIRTGLGHGIDDSVLKESRQFLTKFFNFN
jgi:phospholipase/carboxylesterase